MLWFPIALATAFSLSTADALSKKALRFADESVIVWVREAYALPFLFLFLLFIPVPELDGTFWVTVALLLPLEVTALVLYVKAIKLSPLSLSIPFMALSPVFIILTAFFVLGELPDLYGLAGIFLIAAGAYMLNASAYRTGLLGPLRAIWREPGAVLMIVVAFIYSITSTLGKVAVLHSSPTFFGFFYPFILTIVLTVMLLFKGGLGRCFSNPIPFLAIGFFTALMIMTHFIALSLTDVAYMISVKRTSLIFSVLYGHFLFGEERLRERLLGSSIMLLGVVFITVL